MPKMQVYLPEELYLRLKTRGASINVSGLLQEAIGARLAELEQLEAQSVAVGQYERKFGKISAKERAEQKKKDAANAVYPKAKKPLRSVAA
jgi:post-segregation antitoxin (ccd killing protein)